ncbi:esterase [Bradyrhizobium sp. dw_411]|uniref:esterase n=1 Tax=Bradyrhizobium sp. dw_411 TaxID=2720082 RepID=UPI00201BF4A4|nr:esterase [Bradyrhizobium sp. dw_411]
MQGIKHAIRGTKISRNMILTAALTIATSVATIAAEPIALRDMGSFHVGGRLVEITGKPIRELTFAPGGVPAKIDPNGTYQVEQMYVQYFLPANEKGAYPLLMWHGGGLTGVTWETTPDGREGWLNYFLRKGWSVYNSDAVERGRAGWAQYPDIFKSEPVFLTTSNPFQRFRIGDAYDPDPAKRKLLPGSQFPNEGYENFTKQGVPRWTTNDDATIAAYIAEIDRVCPCIIMFHSQAGTFGFKAAQARPDKVKALIAIEPAGVGDPAKADVLKAIPTLFVYGDYIERDSRWPKIRATGVAFAESIRAAGGSAEVVDLPKAGITGNSHMMMMDKNNTEVAGLIQAWLEGKGLTKKP